MNNDPQPGNSMMQPVPENACSFMKLPRCLRQDTSKRLDVTMCQACISGRVESHLFALRQKLAPQDPNRRN